MIIGRHNDRGALDAAGTRPTSQRVWDAQTAILWLTRYKLLLNDWRGYILAGFAVVWIANVYMSAFGRLRLDIKREHVEIKGVEKDLEEKTKVPERRAA